MNAPMATIIPVNAMSTPENAKNSKQLISSYALQSRG